MARVLAAVFSLALVVAAAVAVAAGGGEGDRAVPVAAAERPDGERACRYRIESGGQSSAIRINRRRDVRIGDVVWFGLRRPEGQIVEAPGRDIGLKSAIAVRAGRAMLLRVPPEARDQVALNYASERDGTAPDVRRVSEGQFLVRVHPCPPRTRRFSGPGRVGRWTAFSGGFVFHKRGCYPLEVGREGGKLVRKRVAFGKRCR